eukprot:scaffold28.g7578.t1
MEVEVEGHYVCEYLETSHPYLLMRRALRDCDTRRVHALLAQLGSVPRVERPLPPSLAPLVLEACLSGDIDCLELLLEREPGLVNVADWRGATPLHVAASRGDVGTGDTLISRGANVTAVTREGFQPLHTAAAAGRRAMVSLLLSRGAPVDVADSSTGATALLLACEAGFIPCAEILLKHHASVNAVDARGLSPLLAALAGGHVALGELLLAAGAAPSARGGAEGRTPLHWAAYWGFAPTAGRLLAASTAELEAEDAAAADTPLLLASRRGWAPIVDALLGAGAAVDRANREGVTPLMASSFFDHAAAVEALLNRGASVCTLDAAHRRSALHHAALGDAAAATRLLLAHAADETLGDRTGATPAALAAECGAERVLQLLQG